MDQDCPVGIDLGTTNSAMAAVDAAGRSFMIPNAEGELTTPSVVFFSDTSVVVGRDAQHAIVTNPDLVAQWAKRDIGSERCAQGIRGRYLPPEVIQACILHKLKEDIVRAVGPSARVVITVPAYFDELRRKLSADAGEMAGLRVLDIINEPTAAALAFGEAAGYVSPTGSPQQELNVLVYDLGGGTFDVTLLHLEPGRVRTIATDGDVQLGGHDWDRRLVDYAATAFLQQQQVDPRQDRASLYRLFRDAVDVKHALSARARAVLPVYCAGRVSEITITREQFEELSADLLSRTAFTTRQLLEAAHLQWKDVQRLLLVGGSTRMPMVVQMLRELTGMEPDRMVNPDQAVARGAALYANYVLWKEGVSPRRSFHQVTNVNAHSLGVEGVDMETLRHTNAILIPRNTTLPARQAKQFVTKSEEQRSIVINVLEGESRLPRECLSVGRTAIRDLPAGLPKGWPVEVTFEYATNGRLSVHATVPGTRQGARLEFEREVGLSDEGIARWKQLVIAGAGFQAFEAAILASLPDAPRTGPSSLLPNAEATRPPAVNAAGTARASSPLPVGQPLLAAGAWAGSAGPTLSTSSAAIPIAAADSTEDEPDDYQETSWGPLWMVRLIGLAVVGLLAALAAYIAFWRF